MTTSTTSGGTVTQPGIGDFNYPSGTVVDINAVPDANYRFVNWTGSAVTAGKVADPNARVTTVTMSANYTLQANFIQTFTITASSDANGTINPSGTIIKDYNSSQVFTATPNTGYDVNQWKVDGGVVDGNSTTYTLSNITANHTVNVTFKIKTFTITASSDANGTINPSGTIVKDYNSSQVFTGTPNTGYDVNQWKVDGGVVDGNSTSYTLSNITANHTVNVTFKIKTFTITASSDANGTINPSGTIVKDYNSSQQFTATPNTGYDVNQWKVDGGVVDGNSTSYTLSNITANHTVNVTFKIKTFTITASSDANGTINPSGTIVKDYNSSQQFTATPNTGYDVNQWKVDGGVVDGNSTSYTLSNITANHTVNVTFKIKTFTITASSDANGTINPSGTIVKDYNSSQQFTATPNTGYDVNQWKVDGGVVDGNSTSYTLSNITANHTVNVTFKIKTFTITASSDANGTINPSGTIVKDYNSSQQFTATPNTGYDVNQWKVDGGVVDGNSTSYTLSSITANHTVAVTFKPIEYTLTLNKIGNGSVTAEPAKATYHYGDSVKLTAIADTNWIFSTWDGGLGTVNPVTITIEGDRTVTATFKPVVPDIVGKTQSDANAAILAVDNLQVGVITSAYSNTVEAGKVISQSPAANTPVDTGSSVDYVVSLGKPLVPDIVGKQQADANATILAVDNLQVGVITSAYSNTVEAGRVISQSPAANTPVNTGSSVDYVVSLGKPLVPDIVGKTQSDANATILAVDNLQVGVITSAYSNTVEAGKVISQSPAANTPVNTGSSVDYVVSLGKPLVPDIVGKQQADANAAILAVDNLQVGVITSAYSNTVEAGRVISQSPAANTPVNTGSSVDYVVSLGKPLVPDIVGKQQADANATILAVDNLQVGVITSAYSNTVEAGKVISQSPAANTPVNTGTSVDYVVSLGKPLVPDIAGKTQADANATILAVDNLQVGVITSAYNNSVDAGKVISQSPAANTPVDTGSSVDYVVSLGKPLVPDIAGKTQSDANAAILAVDNLQVGVITSAYSNTVDAGKVISQSPAANTPVDTGTSVDYVVSLGKPLVPDIVGKTQADANAAILAVDNLQVGVITSAYSNTVEAGRVISQSPAANTPVNTGTSVDYVVSLGKPLVPDIVGKTQADANATILAVDNLQVGVITSAYNNSVDAGKVISQSPAANTPVDTGSSVDYVVSLGKPLVPDIAGKTQSDANAAILAVDNLQVGVITSAYSNTVDAGKVISQSPAANTPVNTGSSVDYVVSLGKPLVPDIAGKTQSDANATILAVDNLQVGVITSAYSNTVDAGKVISQSPAANTPVDTGTSVDYVVSLGKPLVPDIAGKTQADANAAILAVDNLQVGVITSAYSNTVEAGKVISQSPAANTPVDTGTSVDYVVSLGKPLVPDIVGKTQADANAAILAVDNLQVGVITSAYSNSVEAGKVISQSPAANTPVDTGTSVDYVVSLGPQPPQVGDDFNDNRRGAMWRMSSDNPGSTNVVEDANRLNVISAGGSNMAASCVGYWKMNDNAANTVVVDSSGKGNDGTAQRNTSVLHTDSGNPPYLNGALIFDGNYVTTPMTSFPAAAQARTVSFWMKWNGSSAYNVIFGYGSNAAGFKVLGAFLDSAGNLYCWNNYQSSSSNYNTGIVIAAGSWTHVVLTYDGTNIRAYKNSSLVNTTPRTLDTALDKSVIGRNGWTGGNPFAGTIDNMMIFDKALSQDEISYLYNSGNGTESFSAGGGYGSAFYTANGWKFDVNEDFEARVDFHYSDTSSGSDGWVEMAVESTEGNYVSLSAGFDGNQAYCYYEKAVDGNVVYEQTSRDSNDGTLYISYDAGLDKLYLSFTGYGSGNAWRTMSWSSGPVRAAIGGGSELAELANGEAYLDNFEVDSGLLLGWPPATDLDSSGFIDWGDVLVISEYWLATGSDIRGDIVGDDDIVNFRDFAELGLAW